LFAGGGYLPLASAGPKQNHLVAYARVNTGGADAPDTAAIVIAPRLTARLPTRPTAAPIGDTIWSDTVIRLPESLQSRSWVCALTRETFPATPDCFLRVSQTLATFPGALLISHQPAAAARQD
jgi:maltooligosyltrehalose synthase